MSEELPAADELAELAADLRAFVGWQDSLKGRWATADLQLPPVPRAEPPPEAPAAARRPPAQRSAPPAAPPRRAEPVSPRPAPPRAAPARPNAAPPGPAAASPPSSGAPSFSGPPVGPVLLPIRTELGDCQRCKLSTRRKNVVFGVGSETADIVFVGEGPGYHEDQQAEPFVGDAGALLDRIVTNVLRLGRDSVYICNVVKCRPPRNRDPEPDEIEACSPFLWQQLDRIQPVIVITLGRFATQCLLKTEQPIGRLRGRAHPFRDATVVPTYHPAYLLRNPEDKRKVMADMMLVRRVFEEKTGRSLPPVLSGRQARGG